MRSLVRVAPLVVDSRTFRWSARILCRSEEVPCMIQKQLLVPDRVRRPPA